MSTPRLTSTDGHRSRVLSRFDIADASEPDTVYLTRWRIISTPWFGVYLHAIHQDDGIRPLHDHPWDFIRIILWGSYVEQRPNGRYVRMRQGRWSAMPALGLHAIRRLMRTPTWTLCLVGRRQRDWGYQTADGWIPHKEFHQVEARR